MGRYRKIDTRIWNDAKFIALSDKGKLAFLFLLTHPHMTSLGAMRATLPGLASELRWDAEAFGEAFREALRKGLVEHDDKACFVGLPNFLKYNGPESPNVVKSWSESLDLIPECDLKSRLLNRVKGFVEGLSKGFAEALPEAFAKGMPNPEPEQEQEPEQDKNPAYAREGIADDDRPVPFLIPIPTAIDTEPFRTAWQGWMRYLVNKANGRVSQDTLQRQLRKLVEYDPVRAIAILEEAITKGWTAPVWPEEKRGGGSSGGDKPPLARMGGSKS
jgi:hypothetical protein